MKPHSDFLIRRLNTVQTPTLIRHEFVFYFCIKVVGRKSVRNGQQFYGCSQWPGSDCKFFLWKEDVDKMLFKGQPDDYEELKVRNLELQNLLLVEENKNLRQKNSATGTKWEKLIVLILLVIIVVSLYL